MTVYARPGAEGSLMSFQPRYDNYIGGEWVAPVQGRYFENPTPVTGQTFCEVARSDEADIERALDAAHAAAPAWGKTAAAERAVILNKIADRIEENLESIAVAASWDNGKPVRETLNADIPLVVDHFRYFAGAIRAQEGSLSQIDEDTVAYHFHEPLGVVGLIVPWNFPILMATWKLAPALAAGNAVVLKPAEQTPASILYLFSLIGDLLPPGVVNIVNGFGVEAGKPLASSNRIAKIAFTGETTTGRLIMQYASQNLIPVTLELGGRKIFLVHYPEYGHAMACTGDWDYAKVIRSTNSTVTFPKGEGDARAGHTGRGEQLARDGLGEVSGILDGVVEGDFLQAVKALGQRAKNEQAGENENDERDNEHDGRDHPHHHRPDPEGQRHRYRHPTPGVQQR